MSILNERRHGRRGRLAASVAASVLALAFTVSGGSAALADDASDARIQALEEQIAALAEQVQDLKASTSNEITDVRKTQEATTVTLNNGRPTFATGDGQFSASLRGVIHFDAGYYNQDPSGALNSDFRRGSFGDATEASHARDLSDGTNFRRARIGLEGKVFGDFDYSLIYEFGGGGQEDGGRVQDLWIQYSGLKPFRFKVGAFAPPTGLADAGSTNGSAFLERGSSSEIVRGLAGGDGRTGAAVYANGERWFASLAYTGATVTTPGGGAAAQNYDEQSAVLGRVTYVPIKGLDYLVHVGANSTFIINPPDAGPDVASNRSALRLRDRPELRLDGTRLIDTGNINAEGLNTWGLELAAQWRNFTVQSEYNHIKIERANSSLPDPDFSGWYVEGSYFLTGEARRYNPLTAGFDAPKIEKIFNPKEGTWGAFEVALRYSTVDLNYNAGSSGATPVGGIRGGQQDIWSVGLNWYPNNVVRFMAQYQDISVDRLSTGAANAYGTGVFTPVAGTQVGQDLQSFTIRTQLAF
jgi:phosphate-selective porin OprO/OprP